MSQRLVRVFVALNGAFVGFMLALGIATATGVEQKTLGVERVVDPTTNEVLYYVFGVPWPPFRWYAVLAAVGWGLALWWIAGFSRDGSED